MFCLFLLLGYLCTVQEPLSRESVFFFLITPITWFDNLFTEETKRKALNENTAAPSSLLFIPSCNFNIGTTSPWYYFNNYTAS